MRSDRLLCCIISCAGHCGLDANVCDADSNSDFVQLVQVEVANPEAYAFDKEPEIKAQDMGFPDLISIRHKPNTFIFKIESTGALHAYNIVCSALDLLSTKLNNVRLEK